MNPFGVGWAVPARRAQRMGWLVAGMALLLAGCTVSTVQPGTALKPGPDTGIVVFSITRTGDRDFNWWPELKAPGDRVGRALVLLADRRTQDWPGPASRYHTSSDEPVGRLIVLRLAPGTYRIDHWRGDSREGGVYGVGFDVEGGGLGLSFTVRPGVVTYLGNVNFAFPDELNYLANVSDAPYKIEVAPRPKRDLKVLQEKYGIDPAQVQTEPMRFAPAGPLRYYVYNHTDGTTEKQ